MCVGGDTARWRFGLRFCMALVAQGVVPSCLNSATLMEVTLIRSCLETWPLQLNGIFTLEK